MSKWKSIPNISLAGCLHQIMLECNWTKKSFITFIYSSCITKYNFKFKYSYESRIWSNWSVMVSVILRMIHLLMSPETRSLKIHFTFPGASLWGPLKELWETVDGAVLRKQPESIHLLDLQLKKHKTHFLSLFRNPVRCCATTNTSLLTFYFMCDFCGIVLPNWPEAPLMQADIFLVDSLSS